MLLFDQFPRNMFRGDAEQFSTDPLALAIAKGAVESDLDEQLPERERKFLYMPFEHSEDIDDQKRSLLLFTSLGDDRMLDFAKKHHDVIARFGRFPHRNRISTGSASGRDRRWRRRALVNDLVEIARFQTCVEADLADFRLEAEGIEAVLFDTGANSVGCGPMIPVRLMVLDRDRYRAGTLLGLEQLSRNAGRPE